MPVAPVEKELPWDNVTTMVAQAVVKHRPEATATEAYYYMVMQHLAHVLWRMGVGDQALQVLGVVLSGAVNDARARVEEASAATRKRP